MYQRFSVFFNAVFHGNGKCLLHPYKTKISTNLLSCERHKDGDQRTLMNINL